MKIPKNIAASIRQRLLNRAKSDSRPFNELLQYYGMERFLYRLSLSPYAQQFILKGALMLRIWNALESRPTMDIDMLGRTSNEEDSIITQINTILSMDVIEDGLIFNPDTILAERITEDADYQGIRIRFTGALETAKIHMQLDIGFGDIVYPQPEESILPTLLDLPAPKLLAYSRESAIAEKFEAMVKLSAINSRMKDFYDIWMLSRQYSFNSVQLAEAIRLTFNQRGTQLPVEVEAFTAHFIKAKQVPWTAFRKRLQQDHVPAEFNEIVLSVSKFLIPILHTLSNKESAQKSWLIQGQWAEV